MIRAARLGDGVPPGLAYQINGNGEIYPPYLRIRSHSTRRHRARLCWRFDAKGSVFVAERNFCKGDGRWAFTPPHSAMDQGDALFLIGASIRAWFRSPGRSFTKRAQ